MGNDELLGLFDAYNNGELSFAEVILASGLKIKELISFIKENDIEIDMNFGFLDKGRGLEEEELELVLEME